MSIKRISKPRIIASTMIHNATEVTREFFQHYIENTDAEDIPFIVVNNAADADTREVTRGIGRSMSAYGTSFHMLELPDRGGSMEGLKFLFKFVCEKFDNFDYLAFFHNDFFILEEKWDVRCQFLINDASQNVNGRKGIGIAGFGGSWKGLHIDGNRMGQFSYLSNAEAHGKRQPRDPGWESAVGTDGSSIILNIGFLKELMFDDDLFKEYLFHHCYDMELSMKSLQLGWSNIGLAISGSHVNGQTANSPEYQDWVTEQIPESYRNKGETGDQYTHRINHVAWRTKWRAILPVVTYPGQNINYKFQAQE